MLVIGDLRLGLQGGTIRATLITASLVVASPTEPNRMNTMELLTLAVVAGTAGVSALVSAGAQQIVDAVEDRMKWSPSSGDRFVVDDKIQEGASQCAELSLE